MEQKVPFLFLAQARQAEVEQQTFAFMKMIFGTEFSFQVVAADQTTNILLILLKITAEAVQEAD